MAVSSIPILGAWELKLFLLVKRKYTIGNKYFHAKWGVYTLCGQCVFFNQYNNIHLLEKPGGRHICMGYL